MTPPSVYVSMAIMLVSTHNIDKRENDYKNMHTIKEKNSRGGQQIEK